jgi:glycosyltransferase involved in cell wall biosynthesis
MDPKIAIVIPSYNSEQFLQQSVDSAVRQTYKNCNVYIYDNESTDTSLQVAKGLEQVHEKVKVFEIENLYQRSYREAFEHSFENLDFDYITFLASDDYISKDYVSSCVDIIKKSSNRIKCMQSTICSVQDNTQIGNVSHKYKNLTEFKSLCLTKSPVTTPTVVYHKSIYQFLSPKSHIENMIQYGGSEDYDMFCNLADNNIFIYPVPKFLGYYYRWHQNQSTWQVHEQKKHIDYDKIIREYWKSRWS